MNSHALEEQSECLLRGNGNLVVFKVDRVRIDGRKCTLEFFLDVRKIVGTQVVDQRFRGGARGARARRALRWAATAGSWVLLTGIPSGASLLGFASSRHRNIRL